MVIHTKLMAFMIAQNHPPIVAEEINAIGHAIKPNTMQKIKKPLLIRSQFPILAAQQSSEASLSSHLVHIQVPHDQYRIDEPALGVF